MVHGDETVCLVLATDHLISDDAPFERAVGHAQEQVQEGNLVVFGIRPTAPETGYGYLEVAAAGDGPQALQALLKSLTVRRPSNISQRGATIGTQACSVLPPV